MWLVRIFFLVLSMLGREANAQDLTVFGFRLGETLVLPECKMGELVNPPNTCIRNVNSLSGRPAGREITFSNKEMPSVVSDEYGTAFPLEASERLIGMRFFTGGIRSQEAVLQQLTSKYGRPASLTKRSVQNRMGATFAAIYATWRFPRLHVTLEGVLNELDRGLVTIDLPEATKLRAQERAVERTEERKL